MAGLSGLAAGLAQGYASGLKLSSDLQDSEKRREAMGLQMENQKLQNVELQDKQEARTGLVNLEKNWASGTGYKPADAGPDFDHRTDPQAVAKYYEDLRTNLRRMSTAYGRSPTEADQAVDKLQKDQYAEKVGRALSLAKANPEAAIPAIQIVYAGFRDGNTMTGGTYDKATDSYTFVGKDKQGNDVTLPPMTRANVMEALSYAATGSDAGLLNIKALEEEKNRKSREKIATEQNQSQEKIGADRNKTALEATSMDVGGREKVANITAQSHRDVAGINAQSHRDVAGAQLKANLDYRQSEQERHELDSALRYVDGVFGPQIQAIKDNKVASYTEGKRNADIASVNAQQAITERVVKDNFVIGNKNISAREVASLAPAILDGSIKNRITGVYQDPRTGKPNPNFAVVDGRFVIPMPAGAKIGSSQPAPAPTGNGRMGVSLPGSQTVDDGLQ